MSSILIVCETGEEQSESVNLKLISKSLDLSQASKDGYKLSALLIGKASHGTAIELAKYVDDVLYADSTLLATFNTEEYLNVILRVVKDINPGLIFFGHTFLGLDLAPRVAETMRVPLLSNCSEVQLGEQEGVLYFWRLMHKGKLQAKLRVDLTGPLVASLELGGTSTPVPSRSCVPRRIEPNGHTNTRIRPIKILSPPRGETDIGTKDVIVAAGRGIGTKENLKMVRELADALDGALACSRPLVDMGWLNESHQVGISGKSVKPKLYIACGISGAIEHLVGMRESSVIVAINKDPIAPIFDVADYGLVGDLTEIVPELTKELRKRPRQPQTQTALR
jgi:electron transfer flavoprotein alpha subunit